MDAHKEIIQRKHSEPDDRSTGYTCFLVVACDPSLVYRILITYISMCMNPIYNSL